MHSPNISGQAGRRIEVADESLQFRTVPLDNRTPTGAQIARAAGFSPAQSAIVLQFLPDGLLEEIRPEKTTDLHHLDGKFLVVISDRTYRITINGLQFEWPARLISGKQVRKLGNIPAGHEVLLSRTDHPDKPVKDTDLVDLHGADVEAFVSRKAEWKLQVQSVVLTYHAPKVVTREAIRQAGFNPDQGWQVFLKVQGEPKRLLALDEEVDLTTPGIEKIRLIPKDVANGEAPTAPYRDFPLLPADITHLDSLGLTWETYVEGETRWLLIHDYPLPKGYTPAKAILALNVPRAYPSAEIDMFSFLPPAQLESGREISSTQVRYTIRGQVYHGWSRHRQPTAPWNPQHDNVMTHLALVEAAMLKELGE